MFLLSKKKVTVDVAIDGKRRADAARLRNRKTHGDCTFGGVHAHVLERKDARTREARDLFALWRWRVGEGRRREERESHGRVTARAPESGAATTKARESDENERT